MALKLTQCLEVYLGPVTKSTNDKLLHHFQAEEQSYSSNIETYSATFIEESILIGHSHGE